MSQGKLIALSGPSGVGKSTIISALTQRKKDFYFSISATTRDMRPGEEDGVHYHFLNRAQFRQWVDEGRLLEWAEYVGNCYGTPAEPIRCVLENGQDALLDIDVQGGIQVKANQPDAIMIFLVTPDFQELERRLRSRGDTPPELIEKRLIQARWEYAQAAKHYDYIVVNDQVEQAVDEILSILTAEKCKTAGRISLLLDACDAQ